MSLPPGQDADEVWNRACDPFLPFTHPGDAALAAVLLCHGMAMNGGLLQALPEWDETIDHAFRAHLEHHPEAYAPLGS